MADDTELQVQEKKEVAEGRETTVPARHYIPQTDIFEDEDALTVVMEMPGVGKDSVSVDIENDQLKVEGSIDYSNYDGMNPVYTEYSVGNYQRAFAISNTIDRNKIKAELADGVLTLHLPKTEAVKPRTIKVN